MNVSASCSVCHVVHPLHLLGQRLEPVGVGRPMAHCPHCDAVTPVSLMRTMAVAA